MQGVGFNFLSCRFAFSCAQSNNCSSISDRTYPIRGTPQISPSSVILEHVLLYQPQYRTGKQVG